MSANVTSIANGFHQTHFRLHDTNHELTLTLVFADGQTGRSRTLSGGVRRDFLISLATAANHSKDAAMSLCWARLGYSKRMDRKPIASTICHPGLTRKVA